MMGCIAEARKHSYCIEFRAANRKTAEQLVVFPNAAHLVPNVSSLVDTDAFSITRQSRLKAAAANVVSLEPTTPSEIRRPVRL